MDTIKLLRTQGDLCKLSGAFDDGKLLYDAANTIEVYQEVFKDIKIKLKSKNRGTCDYQVVDDIENIITEFDKHNPSLISPEEAGEILKGIGEDDNSNKIGKGEENGR